MSHPSQEPNLECENTSIQEITHSPTQAQDIMIPMKRDQALTMMMWLSLVLLFLIGIDVYFLWHIIPDLVKGIPALFWLDPFNLSWENTLLTYLLGFFMALILCFFAAFFYLIGFILTFFTGKAIWRLFFTLFPHPKAVLTINHEGITVAHLPGHSGFFISWNEIETIAFHRQNETIFLGIYPKNTEQFIKRFSRLQRFMSKFSSKDFPPLYITQPFLSRPIEEILREIYYNRSHELALHNVHLKL